METGRGEGRKGLEEKAHNACQQGSWSARTTAMGSVRCPGRRWASSFHPEKGKSGTVPAKIRLTEGQLTRIICFLPECRATPTQYQQTTQHLQKSVRSL